MVILLCGFFPSESDPEEEEDEDDEPDPEEEEPLEPPMVLDLPTTD